MPWFAPPWVATLNQPHIISSGRFWAPSLTHRPRDSLVLGSSREETFPSPPKNIQYVPRLSPESLPPESLGSGQLLGTGTQEDLGHTHPLPQCLSLPICKTWVAPAPCLFTGLGSVDIKALAALWKKDAIFMILSSSFLPTTSLEPSGIAAWAIPGVQEANHFRPGNIQTRAIVLSKCL